MSYVYAVRILDLATDLIRQSATCMYQVQLELIDNHFAEAYSAYCEETPLWWLHISSGMNT